jgi:hypothetical protein
MPTYLSSGDTYVPANHDAVRLTILSKQLSPAEITLRLGLKPDMSWKLGERPKPSARHAYKSHGWIIGSGLSRQSSVAEHIEALLLKLEPAATAVRAVSLEAEVTSTLWVVQHLENWNPGMSFSHVQLTAIAQLGVELAIDIYVYEPGDLAPMRMPIRVRPPDRGPEAAG